MRPDDTVIPSQSPAPAPAVADPLHAVMSTIDDLPGWVMPVGIPLLVLALVAAAWAIRRWFGSGERLASRVTLLATAIGLTWSATGMRETAIKRYDQPEMLASILFIIFEAWLIGRMLKAHQANAERTEDGLRRRGRFATQVWVGTVFAAVVVALGEGWEQAPARLAIPLLVTYGWYGDLTAADRPEDRPETEWLWTADRVLRSLGLKGYRSNDKAKTVSDAERQALLERLVRLGLRDRLGNKHLNAVLRRRSRLAALVSRADPELRVEARVKVSAAVAAHRAGLEDPDAPEVEASPAIEIVTAEPAGPDAVTVNPELTRMHQEMQELVETTESVDTASEPERPSGSRVRRSDGELVVNYREDALRMFLGLLERADRPSEVKTAALRGAYDPPIGQRVAESIAAEARRLHQARREASST